MNVPFGPYEPDRPSLSAADVVRNVLPSADGWRPQKGFAAYAASALPGACRGAWLAHLRSGVYSGFAGTATGLYKLSATAWEDVSNGTYALPVGDYWSGVQFGENFIAANLASPVQRYQLGVSVDFANLAGSPPQCRYVGVQGDYLLLLSTTDNPNRLHRSGNNDITHWTWRKKGSDYQDLPDGGWIMGMTGRERGAVIYSEKSIRVLEDQPGSSVLFSIAKVEPARGAVSPQSIVQAGNMDFYLSEDGFYSFSPAAGSTPIGAERVDRTFLSLTTDLATVQGTADPVNKVVWWKADTNKLFGYHWQLDRWTRIEDIDIQWMMNFASPGYTLEEIAALYPVLEDVPYSLDSAIWKGGRPAMAAFNSSNVLGAFEGPNMEAVLRTSRLQLGGEGRRGVHYSHRPVGDISGVYSRVGAADTLDGALSFTVEQAQTASGLVPIKASGRVLAVETRIPAGTTWTGIQGVEMPPEGGRQGGRR